MVYKATCNKSGKIYIGNTQQHLKKRMQQPFQDVRKLVLVNKKSDSFAAHFAESFLFSPVNNLTSSETVKLKIREKIDIKVEVVWQG